MRLLTLLVAACIIVMRLGAQDATEAGQFFVEHPTLLNLGFEWPIRGDANRNASVSVQYRAVGDSPWRNGVTTSTLL